MKMIKTVLFGFLLFGSAQFYSAFTLAGEVSIDTADASTLAEELTGVGQKKARAIVEYRNQNGKFSSITDLQNVKGISEKTIEKNKENITL